MPLTAFQARTLGLISANRTQGSHLAGGAAINLADSSLRYSHDPDLFHDTESAVASAYHRDCALLAENSIGVEIEISQPGFIRAVLIAGEERLRVDWAHDSNWRFFEPVNLDGVGWVLHPVDWAVNKVLALAGRDEPRDLLDALYLHQTVLSIGALAWAAVGKDPGYNPLMLIDMLSRRGKLRQEDLDTLDLAIGQDLETLRREWVQALDEARLWIASRPVEEAGCLYADPKSGLLFAPSAGDDVAIIRGQPGGVIPRIHGIQGASFVESDALRESLEAFFERSVLRGGLQP